ncbi:MAG: EF-P lysine aminoacylase GenX [Magnetococcales bacterium]|nr:EF-P lysine aminoacylase GenX [Magnetococcales bacterium]
MTTTSQSPLWQPSASLETLKSRAHIINLIRQFFQNRDVLEVTTPVLLSTVAPERYQNPQVCDNGFLHSSPETAMKRLVAAGYGSIFQICQVFRADEAGVMHNPEFTMLEWYRPGWAMADLMVEVGDLLQHILNCPPPITLTFCQAFQKYVGIDPFLSPLSELSEKVSVPPPDGLDRGGLVDLLLVDRLEPALKKQGGSLFLLDYPAWDPAMAEVDPGPPKVAKRFEMYVDGVELANGYQELRDADEQNRRFLQVNQQRKQDGRQQLPIDNHFLDALKHGLPRCAGVALGVDRLLMLAMKKNRIADVMAFPVDRA